MKKDSQTIKCNVKSCEYQDCDSCTLDEIQVGCNCGCTEATKEQETLCKSFKCNSEKVNEEE